MSARPLLTDMEKRLWGILLTAVVVGVGVGTRTGSPRATAYAMIAALLVTAAIPWGVV